MKFRSVINQEFKFLVDDYGFGMSKSLSDITRCVYFNSTSTIDISYEINECKITVVIGKLVNGDIPERPIFINNDTTIYAYNLLDIISVLESKLVTSFDQIYDDYSVYLDEEKGMQKYARDFAKLVKKYCTNILKGDFVIFEKLEMYVKARIE